MVTRQVFGTLRGLSGLTPGTRILFVKSRVSSAGTEILLPGVQEVITDAEGYFEADLLVSPGLRYVASIRLEDQVQNLFFNMVEGTDPIALNLLIELSGMPKINNLAEYIQSLIDAHNASTTSHSDIRDRITESGVSSQDLLDAFASHNASDTAHPDLRSGTGTGGVSIEDVNTLISSHNSATDSHSDIRSQLTDILSNLGLSASEVDALIEAHNTATGTHADIRSAIGGEGVNPNDVGYDVVLLIGQSNMTGWGEPKDPLLDYSDPRILQYPSSGTLLGQPILADDPLRHVIAESATKIGLAMSFGRRYVQTIPPNRKLLFVPAGEGGTGFGDNRWNPGDDLFDNAVAKANEAIALNPNNRLVAILWHQGENDTGMTKSTYISRLDAMITQMRQQITGAATVPFVLGEMQHDYVVGDTGKANVQAAINETPTRQFYTAVATAEGLARIDGVHFDAPALRTFGMRYFEAFNAAKNNLPSPPSEPTNITATVSGTSSVVSWTQPGFAASWDYEYKLAADTTWIAGTRSQPSVTLSGLTPESTYDFRVRAVNAAGVSGYTSEQFTTTADVPTIPTPLLHLTFNNSLTEDLGSAGYTITLNNPTNVTLVQDAVHGQVMQLWNDSNMYITDLVMPQTYTKFLWVKEIWEAYPNPNFMSNGAVTPDNVFWSPGGDKTFAGGHNGSYELAKAPINNYVQNQWRCAALTFNNATNTMKVFIDGVKVAENNACPNYAGGTTGMFIGAYSGTGGTPGHYKNVRFWNVELSEADILTIYNEDSP